MYKLEWALCLSAAALLSGCGDENPFSTQEGASLPAPGAKRIRSALTISANRVAGTCEKCRSRRSGGTIIFPNGVIVPTDIEIKPADFANSTTIDNPFFPQVPGTTTIFEGEGQDGFERTQDDVLNETKVILGITCVVVQDRVFVDGELAENTFDYYAQHNDGTVWYFGEDSRDIENGEVVSTEGSWEAGVDGALPGIIMLAAPQAGQQYRQEFLEGEAEDHAGIVKLNQSVQIGLGAFTGVIQIEDYSPLEPGVLAQKFYAPGIGLILETEKSDQGDETRSELIEIIAP